MTTSVLQSYQIKKIAGNLLLHYPEYEDLDITKYSPVAGVYTLDIIQKHRPDIELIHREQWQSTIDYAWLDVKISSSLKKGKIVCLAIWDEDVYITPAFINCLLKYQKDPVYVITQLDDFGILGYRDRGINNIIELPWWLLNECLCYYRLCNINNQITEFDKNHNFLCMINRLEPHKINLIKSLGNSGLYKFGDITVTNYTKLDNETKKFCRISTSQPYPKLNHYFGKTRANSIINGIYVSANVENLLKLEQQYSNIPLIINAETSCGVFFSTEKSLWPLLMGRLCLISGKWQVMNYIQKFYNVNFSSYINMEFDSVSGFTVADHQLRVNIMLSKNKNLIEDCRTVYQTLASSLETARFTIGKNMYDFFIKQLERIPQI